MLQTRLTLKVNGRNHLTTLSPHAHQADFAAISYPESSDLLVSEWSPGETLGNSGGRGQLVGSAVRMIRAIVTALLVKRGVLSSFENGADNFAAANDFFFQPGSGLDFFSC